MREKGWNIVGRMKNPVPPLKPGRIGAGSRVTFVDRFGKNRTGTAVMLGPHGWVLNMGGRHGTPHVVRPDTIVKVVNPRRKANPATIHQFPGVYQYKKGDKIIGTRGYLDDLWGIVDGPVPGTDGLLFVKWVDKKRTAVMPEEIRPRIVGSRRKANPEWVQSGGVHIDIGTDNKGKTRVNPRAALMRRAKNPSETRNWEYLEKYYAQVVPAAERLHIPVKKIERLVHAGERTSLATLKKTLARMIEGARKQGSPWTAQAARMANSVLVSYFAIEHGTRLVRKERVTKKRRAN